MEQMLFIVRLLSLLYWTDPAHSDFGPWAGSGERLGRSLKQLIETVNILQERGIGFKSLTEHIDTTSSGGKLIFHVFGALAEFERDLIRERTNAGLAAARARGRVGGRPRRLDDKKLKMLYSLYADKSNSIPDILATLNISKSTLYRYIKEDKPGAGRADGE